MNQEMASDDSVGILGCFYDWTVWFCKVGHEDGWSNLRLLMLFKFVNDPTTHQFSPKYKFSRFEDKALSKGRHQQGWNHVCFFSLHIKNCIRNLLNIQKELNDEVFSLAVWLAPLLYQLGYRIPRCGSENLKIMTQNSEITLSCLCLIAYCQLAITTPDIIERKVDIVLPESPTPG